MASEAAQQLTPPPPATPVLPPPNAPQRPVKLCFKKRKIQKPRPDVVPGVDGLDGFVLDAEPTGEKPGEEDTTKKL